jgi:hypothetical protein
LQKTKLQRDMRDDLSHRDKVISQTVIEPRLRQAGRHADQAGAGDEIGRRNGQGDGAGMDIEQQHHRAEPIAG